MVVKKGKRRQRCRLPLPVASYRLPGAGCRSKPTIIIWVSWYKKSAGMATDVTEDTIRNYALRHDLVDVKVCAVSEKWSGLKLVVRKEKR